MRVLSLLIIFAAALTYAADPCRSPEVYGGLPRWSKSYGKEKITVLTNCAYVVGYSEARKNPVWVAYKLRKLGAIGASAENPKRKDNFRLDPRTRSLVNSEAFDYSRTKCDRGHMAPSYGIGSRYGADAQDETFFMSNMVPQRDTLNRRTWRELEEIEADYFANACEEVWVITGPIFATPRRVIAKSGVEIPAAFYKIIVDELNGKPRALAYRMEQTTEPTHDLDSLLTSVEAVERSTGLDFLHELPDVTEREVESTKAPHAWVNVQH